LKEVLPDCLALTEGFVFNEKMLGSCLADKNEKPYENLLNTATRYGLLNRVNFNDIILTQIRGEAKKMDKPKL